MRYFEIEIQNAHLVMNEQELEYHRASNGGIIDYKVLTEFTEDEIKRCNFEHGQSLSTEEELNKAINYYKTGKK